MNIRVHVEQQEQGLGAEHACINSEQTAMGDNE